ncbi:MAG: branched-chain amino acid ABC transporter permease, partial [Armatimonadetes bacterium]|nr:branched-chain amino acid ABC transporter permease [Armatimonadota bacterium]
MVMQRMALATLVGVLAVAPWLAGRDVVTGFLLTFFLVVLASNYDVLGGHLGLHNLGQATFFGVGAYATFLALLSLPALASLGVTGAVLALVGGGAAAAAFAWSVSGALLRLRSAYFSIGSFALLLAMRLAVDNAAILTGGVQGLYVPVDRYLPLPVAYAAVLALAVGSVALNARLATSTLGLAMVAVRESEVAAAAVGIDAFRVKRIALVLAAVPTALAGGVFGLYAGYIDANVVLGVERSLFPVIAAMIGGSGLVWGPVAGVALLRVIDYGLKFTLRLPLPSIVVYGVILIVVALLAPRGLLAGL